MKSERLFRILGLVDDDLIEEADHTSPPTAVRRQPHWLPALATAACITLICLGSFVWLVIAGFRGMGSSVPEATTESASPEECYPESAQSAALCLMPALFSR